jgi:hypothetical protein
MDTKKISIGRISENQWLIEAVTDYIKANPMVEDLQVFKEFKMRVDLISNILTELRQNIVIERIILNRRTYLKYIEFTDDEFQAISMESPFGNFN